MRGDDFFLHGMWRRPGWSPFILLKIISHGYCLPHFADGKSEAWKIYSHCSACKLHRYVGLAPDSAPSIPYWSLPQAPSGMPFSSHQEEPEEGPPVPQPEQPVNFPWLWHLSLQPNMQSRWTEEGGKEQRWGWGRLCR